MGLKSVKVPRKELVFTVLSIGLPQNFTNIAETLKYIPLFVETKVAVSRGKAFFAFTWFTTVKLIYD